mgnify:FL=1
MKILNESNFTSAIESSRGLVLVKFFSPDCEPCKALDPTLEYMDSIYPHLSLKSVNVDENVELSLIHI